MFGVARADTLAQEMIFDIKLHRREERAIAIHGECTHSGGTRRDIGDMALTCKAVDVHEHVDQNAKYTQCMRPVSLHPTMGGYAWYCCTYKASFIAHLECIRLQSCTSILSSQQVLLAVLPSQGPGPKRCWASYM